MEGGVAAGVLGDLRAALEVTAPLMVCASFLGSTNSTDGGGGGWEPGNAGVLVKGGRAICASGV